MKSVTQSKIEFGVRIKVLIPVIAILLCISGFQRYRLWAIQKSPISIPAIVTEMKYAKSRSSSPQYTCHIIYEYEDKYYKSKIHIDESEPICRNLSVNDTIMIIICSKHHAWAEYLIK